MVQTVYKKNQKATQAGTVVPARSDSDALVCLQLLSIALTCTVHLS